MAVVYKREKISSLIERSQVLAYSRGSRANVILTRCLECFLLFEQNKILRHKNCLLCRWEKISDSAKVLVLERRKVQSFEELETKLIEKHLILQTQKDNVMKAKNCLVHNPPICKRVNK